MKINTVDFGTQEVDPDTIITFPKGLPGFEHQTDYKLFHEEGKEGLFWLQSTSDEDVIFSVIDPSQMNMVYEFPLDDSEIEALGGGDLEDCVVMTMVYQPTDAETTRRAEDPQLRANLMGPIVVNLKTLKGVQKLLGKAQQIINIVAE